MLNSIKEPALHAFRVFATASLVCSTHRTWAKSLTTA